VRASNETIEFIGKEAWSTYINRIASISENEEILLLYKYGSGAEFGFF